MPEQQTIERARNDAREGKSPSTQAGEFVREEFHHVREGKHGARSPKQAIAIGLSKARRAGVKLPPPKPGRTSAKIRQQAERDNERGRQVEPERVSLARHAGSSTPRRAQCSFTPRHCQANPSSLPAPFSFGAFGCCAARRAY